MKSALPAALVLLCASGVLAQDRHLTVAFTGDNGGEVATCGCARAPVGGLPRRKTLLEQLRRGEPTLVLDSGNALFATEATPDETAKKRAALILDVMGELKTAVMPAGARDLSAGPEFLEGLAKHAHVAVLSANLRDRGKPVFEPSRLVSMGGLRVAVIGVSPRGPVHGFEHVAGVEALPLVTELARSARSRDHADVVMVLAAAPFTEALALARGLGPAVDFVLFSHDGRGTGIPLMGHDNALLLTGDRGRSVGLLELELAGTGSDAPFVDLGEKTRMVAALHQLGVTSKETGARRKALPAGAEREALGSTLAGLARRQTEQSAAIKAFPVHPPRGFSLSYRMLGEELREDAALATRVHPLDPLGASRYTPPSNQSSSTARPPELLNGPGARQEDQK